MKRNTKIYSPFKGYTLEDCDCRYLIIVTENDGTLTKARNGGIDIEERK